MNQKQARDTIKSSEPAPLRQRVRHVVIADDHPTIRHMLQKILTRIDNIETGEANSFDSLKALLASTPTDLVLLDLDMPGVEGFSCLSYLRQRYPALRVAVVSGNVQPGVMRTALTRGAVAYIPKTLEIRELTAALETVLAGDSWAPAAVAAAAAASASEPSRLAQLTPQQKRILTLIARGRLNKQIAFELGVTEATVKGHVTTILRRLGLRRRTEAALLAQRLLEVS